MSKSCAPFYAGISSSSPLIANYPIDTSLLVRYVPVPVPVPKSFPCALRGVDAGAGMLRDEWAMVGLAEERRGDYLEEMVCVIWGTETEGFRCFWE
jgi:hypothetical protein